MSKIFGRFFCALATFALAGCLEVTGTATEQVPGDDPTEVEIIDPSKVICDALGSDPSFLERGLVGHLYYLTDDQPRYSSVDELVSNGHSIDADLYFNRLFIPTRPWDQGFFTLAGDPVTNVNGETLYEYFGVDLETELKLAPGEAAGNYQLAILADDGAILRVHEAGGDTIIVNNDGVHSTKLACATQPIYMDANTRLPVQVRYHQGPRYHIAMTILWRPFPTDPAMVVDPQCGTSGNSRFFDSTTQPSTPKLPFYELLERQWKVLETSNYQLPGTVENPCVLEEEPLEISNFALTNITQNSVTVSWTTNVPASSKVRYKLVATGVIAMSPEDPTLVTSHSVIITDLVPNTLYSFKAFSTSAGLQTIESDERAARTLRSTGF
jgi:hypothetical protein